MTGTNRAGTAGERLEARRARRWTKPVPPGHDLCTECGMLVGLGNLAREFQGRVVCDDCLTLLVDEKDVFYRIARRLGWAE